MAVRLVPLGSGSSGNATLVAFGSRAILVDAGLSARDLASRLEAVRVGPGTLDGIVVSHEHNDHARGLERFAARHRVPVWCAPETLEALDLSPRHLPSWHPLVPGAIVDLGEVRVTPFEVPHDAALPLGFVLEGEGVKIGIVTDIGHATTLVRERLRGCHALMIEANHDDRMLMEGPYPWSLKQRVGGRMGHLSNGEAASLLSACAEEDCRAVVLAHLSERNNTVTLARGAAARALADAGCRRVAMRVAERRRPTPEVVL